MAANTKGQGQTIRWIKAHVDYEHDFCLIWPFATLHGYGQFGMSGKNYYAHRYMCELAHGASPSPQHQAAHSCGNGHKGCVNPKHLSWKTKSENQLDCREHGTQAKSRYGIFGKLNFEKAERIRALKGVKLQWEVAQEFGISESTVSDVWLGRTWTRPHKMRQWTADDDAKLKAGIDKKMTSLQIAKQFGITRQSIIARMNRLGLHSKSGHHACKHT